MSKLMSREEVCEYLQISMDTLERILKRGEMQASRVGRQIRITEEAIREYLHKHTMGEAEA